MLDRQRRSWATGAGARVLARAWRIVATIFLNRRNGRPIAPDAADDAARAQPTEGSAMIEAAPLPSGSLRRRPLHVLVVEDDKVNQLVVLGMLRQMAHSADCVADGVEALEALRRQT